MTTNQQLLTDHMDIWAAANTEKKSGRGRTSGNAASVYGIKKLRELILELAVRGKLVPQDPKDEPASELLKRIQTEKAKLIAEGKIRKGQPLPVITEQKETFNLPHGWDCGYFFDETTQTLFCGDLLTQPGTGERPLVTDDILEASEAFRRQEDYYSHSRDTPALIEKLARLEPRLLACMHGSAWSGDGAAMLRRLGQALALTPPSSAAQPHAG